MEQTPGGIERAFRSYTKVTPGGIPNNNQVNFDCKCMFETGVGGMGGAHDIIEVLVNKGLLAGSLQIKRSPASAR
jgi:hypothetical protein